MAGNHLSVFNDYILSTDDSIYTGPDSVVNEVVKNTYLIPRFLKGREADSLQGGKAIKDQIQLDDQATFRFYLPDEEETPNQPQTLTEWEIPWRFSRDRMAWNDETIETNLGGLGRNARHKTYKRLKRQYEQGMMTSKCNGMEDALWAVPDKTEMEGTTSGRQPYSIFAFVNEQPDGLPGALFPGGAWTVVEGIDPTSKTAWVPQQQTYADLPAIGWDGFTAFSAMFKKVSFDRLPMGGQYSEVRTMPAFIATSLTGSTNYEEALRLNQDWAGAVGRQDASFPGPMYLNVPLIYISTLDTAAVYINGDSDALVTENVTTGGSALQTLAEGPRYYFINAEYLRMFFHTSRYFYRHPVLTPPKQPSNHVMYVDTWYNLVCRSRQRNGVVFPSPSLS